MIGYDEELCSHLKCFQKIKIWGKAYKIILSAHLSIK